MKFKSYYELERELNKDNLNRVLGDITELCRTELLQNPKKTEQAQDLIINWWNNKKDKVKITDWRLSYNCLYLLRKEFNKRRKEKSLNKALDKVFVNREKNCKYCKSNDTYLTNLREGFNYRCNYCGEYFK